MTLAFVPCYQKVSLGNKVLGRKCYLISLEKLEYKAACKDEHFLSNKKESRILGYLFSIEAKW